MNESIEILMKYQTEMNRLNEDMNALRKSLTVTNQGLIDAIKAIHTQRDDFNRLLDALLHLKK
jgi:F0F1-type ATP synthase beta subunit